MRIARRRPVVIQVFLKCVNFILVTQIFLKADLLRVIEAVVEFSGPLIHLKLVMLIASGSLVKVQGVSWEEVELRGWILVAVCGLSAGWLWLTHWAVLRLLVLGYGVVEVPVHSIDRFLMSNVLSRCAPGLLLVHASSGPTLENIDI